MNTIPVEEVNTYLLSEAIVNIRATLERLPEGAHRNQLITLIELIEPELSDKDLSTATLARHLSSTIEMQGFGIGGIPKSPESLWPDMKWSLDDRYFYAYSNMIIGIQAVFRSLEAFIDPGSDITKRYKGKLEMGHKPRFHLSACRRPETDRRPSENWIYIENSENSWYSKEELENFMRQIEGIKSTIEILQNKEIMKEIEESENNIKSGRIKRLEIQ